MESEYRKQALLPLKYWKILQSKFEEDRRGWDRVYMIFDMDAVVIERVTNNCVDFWGYEQHEMEGMKLSKFLHPNDIDITLEIANTGLFDMDAIRGFKNRYIRKDGTVAHNVWNTGKTFNNACLGECKQLMEEEFYLLKY